MELTYNSELISENVNPWTGDWPIARLLLLQHSSYTNTRGFNPASKLSKSRGALGRRFDPLFF
jgi:hypothetical protein